MDYRYDYELIGNMLKYYGNWKETVFHYNQVTCQNYGFNSLKSAYNRWVRRGKFDNLNYYHNYQDYHYQKYLPEELYAAKILSSISTQLF